MSRILRHPVVDINKSNSLCNVVMPLEESQCFFSRDLNPINNHHRRLLAAYEACDFSVKWGSTTDLFVFRQTRQLSSYVLPRWSTPGSLSQARLPRRITEGVTSERKMVYWQFKGIPNQLHIAPTCYWDGVRSTR